MSESTIPVITTIGHLALQETTTITSARDLKRGDFVKIKAAKPTNEKPYGYAEVLALIEDRKFQIRRFN